MNLLDVVRCRDEYDPFYKTYYKTEGSITSVPGDIPEEALEVYLNDNHIAVLRRKAFSHLEQCSKLYLDHNSMTIIESRAFKGLDNLDYLYLNNNELQGIRSDMWRGLKLVRTLSLASNRISILQTGAFDRLPKLETLYLGGNELTKLRGDMWLGLLSLSGLYLENNRIVTIDQRTFVKLRNLSSLNLDNNQMTSLNGDIFNLKGHPSTLKLWFGDNPMNCDCRMCWLKEAEEQGWVEFQYGFQYPDCTNHHGQYWEQVQLDCDKNDPEQVQRCNYQVI